MSNKYKNATHIQKLRIECVSECVVRTRKERGAKMVWMPGRDHLLITTHITGTRKPGDYWGGFGPNF